MRSYNDIPIWENLRRQKLLRSYKELIIEYFSSCVRTQDRLLMPEGEEGKRLRTEINLQFKETYSALTSAGVATVVYYSPPPIIGGFRGNVDLMSNIFFLDRYRIDKVHLVDMIEKAIGVYNSDKINAILRTINPLYWLLIVLNYLVDIPFILLGRIGFNQEKIEESQIGRIIKVILYLIIVLHALLGVLQILGYEDWLRTILSKD